MPAPLNVVVNSDALVSGAFCLERPDHRLALQVPSITAAFVTLQFTTTSGTAPFFPLQRTDGVIGAFTVHSGAGPAVCLLPPAPTPWGRLAVSTGTASQVTTFTLLTLTARW